MHTFGAGKVKAQAKGHKNQKLLLMMTIRVHGCPVKAML
jgi:hypothetical protein